MISYRFYLRLQILLGQMILHLLVECLLLLVRLQQHLLLLPSLLHLWNKIRIKIEKFICITKHIYIYLYIAKYIIKYKSTYSEQRTPRRRQVIKLSRSAFCWLLCCYPLWTLIQEWFLIWSLASFIRCRRKF